MAEQAVGIDRALEVRLLGVLPVAGRDSPTALLREPGDGRHEEVPVSLDEEVDASCPRAEHVTDFGLRLSEHAPFRVPPRRLVENSPVPPFDRVLQPVRLERQSRRGAGRRAVLGASHRRHRSSHRVRAVGIGELAMASDAGRVPDVSDSRPGVPVRRVGVRVTSPERHMLRARSEAARPPRQGPQRCDETREQQGRDRKGSRPPRDETSRQVISWVIHGVFHAQSRRRTRMFRNATGP